MATFFNKQSSKKTELTEQEIEQLWQQITEKIQEARDIYNQLMDAGAFPLDEDDLDQVSGGVRGGGGMSDSFRDIWGIVTNKGPFR
ncbi:MAG: hypothetical protein J6Y33_01665 [Prevotella sp.]|nr:hypothetical protein [Prevotella sp.]